MDEKEAQKYFLIGVVCGVLLTILFWVMIADQVELNKVKDGYLTYKDKTYEVILYDTLDVPEKDK